MKVIIDTNIIFSALLNSNASIGSILFNSGNLFEFYGCSHMRTEIRRHWTKLKNLSGLSEENLQIAYDTLLAHMRFISEELIPPQTWRQAEEAVADIDIDDIDFVALTLHLRGFLWTGDKALHKGLKRTGFDWVFNTAELLRAREE